ncbi:MAG: hypothetical protein ACTIJJ_10490 [Galactobacter sp.]|uniref:hypothetical protein n=1 Tax=Galactobacter sp. TaxID=2676125 RepID=UPI0025BBF070|nr:hypothetical protein [Galactobacter sp.]
MELWSTLIPNWIMALAAVAGAFTLVVGFKDLKDRERERARAERKEVSDLGDRVHVDWVIVRGQWGLLVQNRLPSVIESLLVQCNGNEAQLSRADVASGEYFFASKRQPSGQARGWEHPIPVDPAQCERVSAGKNRKFAVLGVEFTYKADRYKKDDHGNVVIIAAP